MRTPRAPRANKTLQMIVTDETAYATILAQKMAAIRKPPDFVNYVSIGVQNSPLIGVQF